LDSNHDRGSNPADVRMQQATVNLFADMNTQPATLQSGLVTASFSTDITAPTSTIISPVAGSNIVQDSLVTISGTATDTGGGVVGGIEISVDGGITWHPATGRENWSYAWTPSSSGSVTIKSRAVDDSGNLASPSAGINVTVNSTPLSSLSVTPASPSISTGGTQQLTVTGTYSNGSTQDLTSQVIWQSSNTSVATIANGGLATGLIAGSATISATLSGVTGTDVLTVQATPLAISTASLSGGEVGAAYSATLTASGGKPLYTWSIISGSLPGGLNLNSATGTISGTLTTAGLFNFTVQATDSASPVATITKALNMNITVGVATVTIWPSTTVPGVVDSGDGSAVELGVKFTSDVGGTISGIRFYKATANTGTHVGTLWTSTGTQLAQAIFTSESASGWQQVNFTSPVSITAGTVYVASYHTNTGHYSFNSNNFASAVNSPPLHALASGVSGGNGMYLYGAGGFPTSTYNASNYWVDVVFN
jgi:hypothetical protein